jgi:hypothetical protein
MAVRARAGRLAYSGSPRRLLPRHEAVRERLHEAHQRVFFLVRESKLPHLLCIHVLGRLRWRPASRAFARIIRQTARESIARVVTMSLIWVSRLMALLNKCERSPSPVRVGENTL